MSHQTGRFYQTPSRGLDGKDTRMTTAGGRGRADMAESKYERNGQQTTIHINQQQLTDIQKRIKEIGQQLRELNIKMTGQSDTYSQNYLEMEQQRKQLKKEIIELDYRHKMLFAERMKESRKIQQQKREHIRREMEEKEHARKQQAQKNEGGENLQESRRKLRMAEIQAQLAESKLRRSRIERLNAQLDYLRLTYRDPYLYPYSSYSYLYPSSYYLYPSYYSSYYSYPYYSSYYPRSWWLYY